MRISFSEANAFRKCRRSWDLGSRNRQGWQQIKVNTKLFLGTLVHECLDKFYSSGKTIDMQVEFKKLFKESLVKIKNELKVDISQEDIQAFNEQEILGLEMLKNYVIWSEKIDKEQIAEIVSTEKKIEVKLFKDLDHILVCRIDGIVKDKDGKYWILEHKTAKSVDTNLALNEQPVLYCYLAEKILGVKIEGILYNTLLKSYPEAPNVLKNGTLSKSKSQNTTWELYQQKIKELKLNEEDYLEMKSELKTLDSYFDRQRIFKTQHEIKDIVQRYREICLDMAENPRIYPTPSRDCNWFCGFKEICVMMNDGLDYKFVLENLFKQEKNSEIVDEKVENEQ